MQKGGSEIWSASGSIAFAYHNKLAESFTLPGHSFSHGENQYGRTFIYATDIDH